MNAIFKYISNIFGAKAPLKPYEHLQGLDKMDAIFHNLAISKRVPGLAITLVKKGKISLQKGYGYADLEKKKPVDPKKTLFRIASISKCITGLALGKMVEEGLLDFDDSFYDYVPEYPKKEYDFTLRQLACHTAGIRGYRGKEYALNKPYSIRDSIEVFKDDALVFKPGKGYLYNSFDFVLLSLAMQEACGMPFENYVREKVLEPLEMKNTIPPYQISTFQETRSDRQFASFYTKTKTGFKNAAEVNNFYKLAGGGYLSTSHDISLLGEAVLGRNLVESHIWNELLSSQLIADEPTYYGLGYQVSKDNSGRAFVGHVGNSVGAYSNFFVYPQEQCVVSILVNCTDPKIQKELDTILLDI